MKKYFLLVVSFCSLATSFSQNTFPSSGNVGIGTTSPAAALSFTDVDATSAATGMTWYSAGGANTATAYAIHKTSGSWSAPNYQQLRLGWTTGIVLDPGTQYGKSYVDITGNGLRVTNGSIGIGTTTPLSNTKLHVEGGGMYVKTDYDSPLTFDNSDNSWQYMQFMGNGVRKAWMGIDPQSDFYITKENGGNVIFGGSYVGIGATGPRSRLEVTGDGRFSPSNSGSSLIIESSSLATGNNYSNVRLAPGSASGSGWLTTKLDNWGGYFNWTRGSASGDVELMRIDATNGTVGIGTSNIGSSTYKLYVESGIRTRKVKVDQNGWPDYVFSSDYKLLPLKEVEQFIKQHQHLPEVPSAQEIDKEGLNLGENQSVLLKKVEELTLYVIEQEKQIELMKEEIATLKLK
jgi:hypothetical protein